MIVMDKEQYLHKKGVGFIVSDYNLDKVVFPHGETRRQMLKRQKTGVKVENDYQEKRAEAIKEYEQLVSDGKIRPKTKFEHRYEIAVHGHPDLESTQAARRILSKYGYHIVYSN